MPIYYKKVQPNETESKSIINKTRGHFSSFGSPKRSNIMNSSPKVKPSRGENELLDQENIEIDVPLNPLSPIASRFNAEKSSFLCHEERLATACGGVLVAFQGLQPAPKRPCIVTYHDVGLNYISNFETFFTYTENRPLLSAFTILHINAPGQEPGSQKLSDSYPYPSMDQLAQQVIEIMAYFNITTIIGFGVGFGANVLARVALVKPQLVDGLFLVNPTCNQSSWGEWFCQKRYVRQLLAAAGDTFLPDTTQQYLIWYHFGGDNVERDEASREVADLFRTYFKTSCVNPFNLALLMNSYMKRDQLPISRTASNGNPRRLSAGSLLSLTGIGKGSYVQTLNQTPKTGLMCQTLLISGQYSPICEETVVMNSKLNPERTTWMRIDNCAMVLEEKPEKVAQALRLFLQGLGFRLRDCDVRRARLSGVSLEMTSSGSPRANIFAGRRMTFAM